MDTAARQLLRAVRGSRSQLALSRRLGYRGNPVANWESGRRFPTAREFLRICDRVGIDAQAAFERFLPAAARGRVVAEDLAGWLSDVRGSTPLSRIAERAECSRFAVSRCLRGLAEPRLPLFLRLVEATSGRVSDLCAELVPIERVPVLEASYRRRQAARLLAFIEPWTEAVLRVLETPAYDASTESSVPFIARQLGLDEAVVQRCLEQLVGAGLVKRAGSRHRISGALTVDTQAAPDLLQRVRAHWTEVALRRIPLPWPGDQFGYNVVSVGEDDLERIRAVLRATFREIRAIVAGSDDSERVALINLQLVQLTPASREVDTSPRSANETQNGE